MPKTGKPGTITAAEFETLETLAEQYGAMVLAKKLPKIATRIADGYKHEFAGSPVGAAWASVAHMLSTRVGAATAGISNDAFKFLGGLVNSYGVETVVSKLAKLAARNGDNGSATTLKAVFPSARRAA
jgi:hypothetical protein